MSLQLNGDTGVTFNDASLQGAAASPFGLKNRIINGDMVISQRNGTTAITPTGGTFTVDRWAFYFSQASKFTIQQNQNSVTPPAGFTNYLGFTVASAVSIGAGDYFTLEQPIEGFNVADLGWGTANARTVTLSFWARSSLTGTFGGALYNSAGTYSYAFNYTISAANTWEYKTITITGPTTGTFSTNNTASFIVTYSLGVGSTYSGTAGTWAASNLRNATGSVSVVGTAGATFYITGVQLERNTTATPFEWLPYTTELQLCQRYFEVLGGRNTYEPVGIGFIFSGTAGVADYFFKQTMRTAPSLTISTAGDWTVMNSAGSGIGLTSLVINDSGNQVTVNGVCLRFQVPSGLTAGNATGLEAVNTNARMSFSAEL
jgi:hypothetical protein